MNLIFSFFKKLKKRIGVKVTKQGGVEIYWKKNQLANIHNNKMNPINGFPIIDENPYREDLSSSFDSINPATGLPTSNGIDVGGNPYGVNLSSSFDSINPATGLPTSNGIDVGGNPYGVDLSSSFDHSFQDLGNSYHNDFHHN